ncbi:MAG: F0F1 ATP synthase subunit A [Saprospiraceae bacterium]|nr:F0F1 ATP synthase subunit A [Saprospiraceae bacterium]
MKGLARQFLILVFCFATTLLLAQHENDAVGHDHSSSAEVETVDHQAGESEHAAPHTAEKYNPSPAVMNHIGDAHEFHIWGQISIPLPCITYEEGQGLSFFSSASFHHGTMAYNGYVLDHGVLRKAIGFPTREGVELEAIHTDQDGHAHYVHTEEVKDEVGKIAEHKTIHYQGQTYPLESSSKIFAATSWTDFSITKNVFTMFLATILLFLIFFGMKRFYANNEGKAPRGLTNFMEPFFEFMRDEVVKPSIGPKWEKYMGLIMSLFFFILVCNLLGLIPFFPGSGNVMGNISVTIVLALITFVVVNFSGNKHYWQHIFWMPNVPVPIKILFIPIELAGLFIKPFTLLIRLFANITAGHTIILSLVSLIFIFGEVGQNVGGASVGAVVAFIFVAFMNLLELLVAVLQAFIFALLSALYIGAAVEEHHHEEAH